MSDILDNETKELIIQNIKKEKMDLCVICYGGCSSNTLVKTLEQNGYKIRTPIWSKILCHCPEYFNLDIPIIYLYENPIRSFLSQKRRNNGIWNVNQKKLWGTFISYNDKSIDYNDCSDEKLLTGMINQFYNFTQKKRDNVLILKTDELFNIRGKEKIENFLNKKMSDFPIEKKIQNTKDCEILIKNMELLKLFYKYKSDIRNISIF